MHCVVVIANGPSVRWAYHINDAPEGTGAVLDGNCDIARRVAVGVVDAVEDTPREPCCAAADVAPILRRSPERLCVARAFDPPGAGDASATETSAMLYPRSN